MIVIVAALRQEFAWIEEQSAWGGPEEDEGVRFCAGTLAGQKVALVVSGVGEERAAHATRLAVKRYAPGAVISIGYAGGLVPEASAGALIVPDSVAHDAATAPSTEESPDARLLGLARSAAARLGVAALGGRLLTVPAVVSTKEAKKAVQGRTGAVAVDMESAAVGAVCRELGIPVLYLRCVTDGSEDDIPINQEISAAFRGKIRVGAILWWFLKHPSVALAIFRLYRRAHRASALLGCVILALCESLR